MRFILAALAFSLSAATVAHAGTIAFTVTTAAGTQTVATTIADADLPRVVAAYREVYSTIDSGTKDADGNPVMRARTDAEVIQAIMDGLTAGIIDNVANYERGIAAKAGSDGVKSIAVTPQ